MLREDAIIETAQVLERLAYEIADLSRVKEELEKHMAALLEHPDNGQKSYIEGRFKITCKTGYNYVLDKEKYEMLGRHLNSSIDPITRVTKYEINKKILRESYEHASAKELEILNEIISKRPAKLNIQITAGV